MFDDIFMNMIMNKELEYHKELFDSFFTKIKNKLFICTLGQFNDFTGIKALTKVLMFHVYI